MTLLIHTLLLLCASAVSLPADHTGDGVVDGADMAHVLANWNAPFTGADLAVVLANWNATVLAYAHDSGDGLVRDMSETPDGFGELRESPWWDSGMRRVAHKNKHGVEVFIDFAEAAP